MNRFSYNSVEQRSINVPGGPAMTRRQRVTINNGKGVKVVEDLKNGSVVARGVVPVNAGELNKITNRQFIPGLFKECCNNMSPTRTARTAAAKRKNRRSTRKSRR